MNEKISILLILSYISAVAYSQEASIIPDSISDPPLHIDEVVVKASKVNSRLKDLPLSATVLDKSDIEVNEITSLKQASAITPNFVMPDYGSKLTSPVYIRGVGSRINSPSVGLYVDNVPYFEKSAFDFDLFDIERIEILRGPQGTLYGRNSMGGLIHVVTRSPMQYQGTRFGFSAANYGNYNVNAGHYAKISKVLGFSLSLNYNHSDGFYTNHFDDKKVDRLNSFGLNNKLIYNISDKLTIENVLGLEISKQGGYPYALYNDSLQKAEPINYNQASSYDRNLISDALKFKYAAPRLEITNSLTYQYLDDIQRIDQDFTPDSLYFVKQFQEQNMVADELIVQSKDNKKLHWLFGIFGFFQQFDSDVAVDVFRSDMWYLKGYEQKVRGMALFHQSTFNITGNLAVTAGMRYDHETSSMNYIYLGTLGENNLPETDTLYPALKDHIFLPKIAANYKFKNISIYASFTTGYKPGGFNTTFEKPEHLMFRNETSRNYETGMKGTFFQRLIYADIALFYTKLNDQQIYRTVPSGRGSYLDNAGLSENKGIEVSIKNIQVGGFEGMIAYGYTSSKILEYVKDSVTNYNNNFTPYIPNHTFAVQLSQTLFFRDVNLIDQLQLHVLYSRNGTQYWTLENNYKEKACEFLNAKISFIKKGFQVDLWMKNLLNSGYNAFLFEALDNTYAQVNKPFQFGVNISMEF